MTAPDRRPALPPADPHKWPRLVTLRGTRIPDASDLTAPELRDWIDVFDVELDRLKRAKNQQDAESASMWASLPFGIVTAGIASWIAVTTAWGAGENPLVWILLIALIVAFPYGGRWFWHEKVLPWRFNGKNGRKQVDSWRETEDTIRDIENRRLLFRRCLRELGEQVD